MAEFDFTMQQHRNQLTPAFFQRWMLIDVDDLDRPAEFFGQWRQRIDEFVTQMAPLAAQHRQVTCRSRRGRASLHLPDPGAAPGWTPLPAAPLPARRLT